MHWCNESISEVDVKACAKRMAPTTVHVLRDCTLNNFNTQSSLAQGLIHYTHNHTAVSQSIPIVDTTQNQTTPLVKLSWINMRSVVDPVQFPCDWSKVGLWGDWFWWAQWGRYNLCRKLSSCTCTSCTGCCPYSVYISNTVTKYTWLGPATESEVYLYFLSQVYHLKKNKH